MATISFKNFSFKYSELDENTLTNINLDICEGEKVLITGKSGSGKSTLGHCINGLIPFKYKGTLAGSIEVNGKTPEKLSLFDMGKEVGTILQDQDSQFIGLSAGEDVAFAFENDCVNPTQMHEWVDAALNQVDMLDHKSSAPQNLSGGQKQKVAIAGMLAMNTPILLFDEPLANLDPASGKKAMETINYIHKHGNKTVIVIEHRIEDVLEHGFDRVIIIDDGKIVADMSADKTLAEGFLPQYGLRQPLYIEMLAMSGAKLCEEDQISRLENTIKYKELVLEKYRSDSFVKKDTSNKLALRLDGICYKYYKEDPYTIEGITFDVHEKEMLAIVGNNGARYILKE